MSSVLIKLDPESMKAIQGLTAAVSQLSKQISGFAEVELSEAVGPGTVEEVIQKDVPTEAAVAEVAQEEPAKETPKVGYEECRAKLMEATQSFGRDPVVEVLAQFGVEKFPDLDEKQYPELLESLAGLKKGG